MPYLPPILGRKTTSSGKPKENRGTAAERGYDHSWRSARRLYLASHPLCTHCLDRENRTTAATVIDHVIPHRGDKRLFWDRSNWQPLCDRHHNEKTAGGQ